MALSRFTVRYRPLLLVCIRKKLVDILVHVDRRSNRKVAYHSLSLFILFFVPLLFLAACDSTEQQTPFTPPASSVQRQPVVKKEYIPALEYLALHPRQKELSRKFNAIVQAPPVPLPQRNAEPVSIAFVYPGVQASDYWRRSVLSFVSRMKELNLNFTLSEYYSKGGGVDIHKQEQQLREALAKDPDYLVFTLDVYRHRAFIERILARGRPTLILQNITTPLSIWEKTQPYYVGFDHGIGTRMLAEYFLDRYGPNHHYGMLYYSEGYVSKMRGDSFIQFMREGGGPRLVASYYTDGQMERAKAATITILEEGEPDFLYACSTDVALGAVEALKEKGKHGQIPVNGWGGGSAELAAIARGELVATVMRMNDDNGVAMAEIIRLALTGQREQLPVLYSGSFTLVTSETPEEVVAALKKQAFRYSGTKGE